MEHADEKILKQRAAMEEFEKQRFSKETVEEENKQSIFDGKILINKIPVAFAERKLIDDRIAIWMPEDFEELPPEAIAAIYPLGNKPELVLGNAYLNLSVGFRYTEHELPDDCMAEFVKVVRMILEKAGPKVRILSEKVNITGEHTVSSLELISHTITDSVYNKMFFSSLEGRVLMGFMNFSCTHLERYKSITEEMAQSFRFVNDKELPV